MKIEKPSLDQIWETWIRIGPANSLSYKMIQDTIRERVGPTFSRLLKEEEINWFQFLIHPFPGDQTNAYFHIRFSPTQDTEIDLPTYCTPQQKINVGQSIAGVNRALLKNNDIAEAWRIIGEQSAWIIEFIEAHKEDNGWIPVDQTVQFMHFFFNMLGLGLSGSIKLQF
ncbi:MAG: hypothetical protein AM325_015865 [Candidatus Thorarchaeota archaeon SMTZ1-45]